MTLSTRTVTLSAIGLAIFAGLFYVSVREEPVLVDLHTLERGSLQGTISADGVSRIKDIYEISSPIAGTAQRSPVAVGDLVMAGDSVVAIVEPATPTLLDARTRRQAEASLQEANAALHVAQTDLQKALEDNAYAKSQFERIQTLVERKVSSVTQLEAAQQRLAVSDAGVEAARARIDMASSTLARAEATLIEPDSELASGEGCCVRLVAPVDGVVLTVPTISEHPVTAGAVLTTIGDPSSIEIVVDLLTQDAVRLPQGARAQIERWGGDPIPATLDRVEPLAVTKVSALGIEEQRVDAIFTLLEPNQGLGEGFSVFARIIEWEADDILTIPLSAIFRSGETWQTFVAQDDRVEIRDVEIGRRTARLAEVLDGLAAGDSVVLHPSNELAEGRLIAVRP